VPGPPRWRPPVMCGVTHRSMIRRRCCGRWPSQSYQ
jgi:hypothetical protein